MKTITLPENWIVDRIEGNHIFVKETEEAEKELPKTWEECCSKLGEAIYIDTASNIQNCPPGFVGREYKNTLPSDLGRPMLALMQLLVCREVYRQGWKPDWADNNVKYVIECSRGEICVNEYVCTNKILSFQSKEIRKLFVENFKDLIEETKELI